MGNTRQVTVNSVTPTLITASVDCSDIFIGEDPVVSGASFPKTALLIIKQAVSNAARGVPAGYVYQLAEKAIGPRAALSNFFGGHGKYLAGTNVCWVQTVTGSITLFIDEEGAS